MAMGGWGMKKIVLFSLFVLFIVLFVFRLQTYCSAYSEVRWRNDYVHNCWIFSLPIASKDFLYPLYKPGDVLEERQMQILHAVMSKDSWIIKWRECQFYKGETQVRKHLLVNSGGNAGVIVKHSDSEREMSEVLMLSTPLCSTCSEHFLLLFLQHKKMGKSCS